MISLYGRIMNFIFGCMPQDKPGQPHDYAAERVRNERKPPNTARGLSCVSGVYGYAGSKESAESGIYIPE